jgi:hypothetical protein
MSQARPQISAEEVLRILKAQNVSGLEAFALLCRLMAVDPGIAPPSYRILVQRIYDEG